MKILVSCANGAGSSLMLKRSVEKATKDLNIKVSNIHHCSISEGKSSASKYDVVFTPLNFVDMFKDAEKRGTKVIGIKNILSAQEVADGLKAAGYGVE